VNRDETLLDTVRLFLPKYLTPGRAKDLWTELSAFPENRNYYLTSSNLRDDLLQGDGWQGFVVVDFASGTRKSVTGMIISNSCDISLENSRSLHARILFAPLIEVAKLRHRLFLAGRTPEQVDAFLADVRRQRITSIFYLPQYSDVMTESVVLLDDIHSHPSGDFLNAQRTICFRLNQFAFYLFLMKLSIHLCRFQEGVPRFDGAA